MAFVRWRGRCAQLLATVYSDGKSKQITLAALQGFDIAQRLRDDVERQFPDMNVDWIRISRELAKGPPKHLREPPPDEHQVMAETENHLRRWATCMDNRSDASKLRSAADILLNIRTRFYFKNELLHAQHTEQR